jgi:hypothetical protein
VISDVALGVRPQRPSLDLEFSDQIWSLISRCWDHKASNRPTANQVTQDLQKMSSNRDDTALSNPNNTSHTDSRCFDMDIPSRKRVKEWLLRELRTYSNVILEGPTKSPQMGETGRTQVSRPVSYCLVFNAHYSPKTPNPGGVEVALSSTSHGQQQAKYECDVSKAAKPIHKAPNPIVKSHQLTDNVLPLAAGKTDRESGKSLEKAGDPAFVVVEHGISPELDNPPCPSQSLTAPGSSSPHDTPDAPEDSHQSMTPQSSTPNLNVSAIPDSGAHVLAQEKQQRALLARIRKFFKMAAVAADKRAITRGKGTSDAIDIQIGRDPRSNREILLLGEH